MMKTNILILSLLCSGLNAGAQQAYLSREEYRDKVEAYSQILKQQHLKTFASTEARKIASTGFLPQIDITAEGTANLNHLDQWNSPKGDYHPYTYQALATLTQPLYTGGSLIAQKKVAQAEEALDQLTTELTLDQIHYQSDAVYWNTSAARAGSADLRRDGAGLYILCRNLRKGIVHKCIGKKCQHQHYRQEYNGCIFNPFSSLFSTVLVHLDSPLYFTFYLYSGSRIHAGISSKNQ